MQKHGKKLVQKKDIVSIVKNMGIKRESMSKYQYAEIAQCQAIFIGNI